MRGLGKEWGRVLGTLSDVIKCYDEMNKLMSFGRDLELREEGVEMLGVEGLILDAGSGPGNMGELMARRGASPILMDPLLPMLKEAKRRVKGAELVNSEFEHMPFRDGTFDRIACAFSLRDARELESALDELARCLKDDGRMLILELSKPKGPLRFAFYLYFGLFVPLLALIRLGRKGLKYVALFRTYRLLPSEEELLEELSKRFEEVRVKREMLGAVHLIVARGVKVNKRRDSW